MIFPWNGVFEYFRERGRGALFIGVLGVALGLIAAGGVLEMNIGESAMEEGLAYAGVLLGLVGLVQIALWIKRARARRLNRYKVLPLSRDEICKARSKLMKKHF